jgi:hypothetical protein
MLFHDSRRKFTVVSPTYSLEFRQLAKVHCTFANIPPGISPIGECPVGESLFGEVPVTRLFLFCNRNFLYRFHRAFDGESFEKKSRYYHFLKARCIRNISLQNIFTMLNMVGSSTIIFFISSMEETVRTSH